ncbi:hypothetical protein [Tellurirhabdus bombi]|uniref:hypothetical protein n=1 Tax=Tellurirhabdus bombi TaxID=2907205 RepID=UPI001F27F5C6|nr:hypothetical protein [Tellurirhabdus bombi]
MKYLLDELEIESPLQSDGLKFRKERNRRYWGFLYRSIGYVEGLGSVTFSEAKAVRLLRDRYKKSSVQAQTRFRIMDGIETAYDGAIDYSQYSDDGERISVALRDPKGIAEFEANLTTRYSIDADTSVYLHARRLSGAATYTLNPDISTVRGSAPFGAPLTLTHSVPMRKKDEREQPVPGTLLSVDRPEKNTELYQNTTDHPQSLIITGMIKLDASASTSLTPMLRVRVGGLEPIPVGTFSVTNSPELIAAVVSITAVVPPNEKLWLEWYSTNQISSYTFAYHSDTAITVRESINVPDSFAGCLTAGSLLAHLVNRASGGSLTLKSDFFATGPGSSLLVTNGANLRGVVKPVVTNYQDLFESLDRIFNLKTDVVGDRVVVEKKQFQGVSRIKELNSFREVPNLEMLFSEVLVGYETWQGESLASGNEVNSLRQYRTGITTVRKSLDLRSKLIASGTLIEEQRRKQYQADTASSTKADTYDESLFLICAHKKPTGWHNERLEAVDFITGILEPENALNLRITPRRNLSRWASLLIGCGQLVMESATGNASAQISYDSDLLSESAAMLPSTALIGSNLTTLEAPLSMVRYRQLGDHIEFFSPVTGAWKTGLLMDASWRRSQEGDTVTLVLYT